MPLVNAAGPPLVDVLDDLVSRFVLNCPDEEKASFDRLFFQIELAFWFYDDHYREQFPEQYPTLTLKSFAEKLFKHCEVLKPYEVQSAELFAKFTDYKGQVPTYGAIILDSTLSKLLLIRSWNGTTWAFPKGKINKDEAEHECAIREVDEEIGLDLRAHLDTAQFLTHSYGRGTTVKLYLVCGIDVAVHLETRTKKEIGAIEWHALSELGTEASKKDKDFWLVQQVIARIKKWASDQRKAQKAAGGGKAARVVAPPPPPPPVAHAGAGAGAHDEDDGFMFGYERERVDVYGGGVIEGGHQPKAAGAAHAGRRPAVKDSRQTFGADEAAKGWSAEEMFRTNERKFALQSTYDYELYTTSLSGKPSVDRAAETTQAARVRRATQPPPMQRPAGEAGGAEAAGRSAFAAGPAQPAAAPSGGGAFQFERGSIMRAFDDEYAARSQTVGYAR
jgi:mRNA-decapping enzyme subunit 2